MYLVLSSSQELPFSILYKQTNAAYFKKLFQEFHLESDYLVKKVALTAVRTAFHHFPL